MKNQKIHRGRVKMGSWSGVFAYTDIILVPLSLFITVGYHAYLWHNFMNNSSLTTIGFNVYKQKLLFQELQQGDDVKKGTLGVQSLRNSLMETILTATMAIIMMVALAALSNNSYNANNLLNGNSSSTADLILILGLHSREIIVLKYGAATILLLFSFLCSSVALANLIDANLLINSTLDIDEEDVVSSLCSDSCSIKSYTLSIVERGFVLAVAGSRLLCIAFSLMMWLLSPVLVFFSSLAIISVLYAIDFN